MVWRGTQCNDPTATEFPTLWDRPDEPGLQGRALVPVVDSGTLHWENPYALEVPVVPLALLITIWIDWTDMVIVFGYHWTIY